MMYKKGLISGLFAIIIILFIFAISSLIALTGWNMVNDNIQGLDNSTVSPDVKEKINSNVTPIFSWGDKIFVFLFITLLLGYLITSATLPVEQPIFLLIFIGFLILFTVFSMMISNAWGFLGTIPVLVDSYQDMTFTNFFMNIYPLITFIIGIAGALIFYGRKSGDSGGNTDVLA